MTSVFPTTVDSGNTILGLLNPVVCGVVGVAEPDDPDPSSPGVVGLCVTAGVEVSGQGADVDRMLKVRVELAV